MLFVKTNQTISLLETVVPLDNNITSALIDIPFTRFPRLGYNVTSACIVRAVGVVVNEVVNSNGATSPFTLSVALYNDCISDGSGKDYHKVIHNATIYSMQQAVTKYMIHTTL